MVERVVPQRDSNGATSFGVRSMVYLAITYDHRIIDGADAARFLATIKMRLNRVSPLQNSGEPAASGCSLGRTGRGLKVGCA
jgi:hypothetical protein